jgi:integrase/recombinase XerD
MENEPETAKRKRAGRTIPKVNVYAVHRAECKHKGDSKRITCGCPKQLAWFADGKLTREAAPVDYTAAEKAARDKVAYFEALAAGEQPAPPPAVAGRSDRTLAATIEKFLATKSTSGVTEKHVAKLKFELQAFADFSAARGLLNLIDITNEDALDFRNALKGSQSTLRKKIHRLGGFFRFAVEMGWLSRNPFANDTVRIKAPKTTTPKAMDARQLDELFAAIPRLKLNGDNSEETRRTLTAVGVLMRWAGLAVRDAVTIERAAFQKNGEGFTKLFLHRAKTGHEVMATLKNEIVEQIFSGARASGKYLFIESLPETEKEMDALAGRWSSIFSKLGKTAAIRNADGSDFHFGSHCLRHSFAAMCFMNSMPTEDVALLLGDSVQVVADSYSGFIHGRQERLTERMKVMLTAQQAQAASAGK